MTNNLEKRIYEHKHKIFKDGFSSKYNLNKLVYYEITTDVNSAIQREKYIKGKTRNFKNELIISKNPNWEELIISWIE